MQIDLIKMQHAGERMPSKGGKKPGQWGEIPSSGNRAHAGEAGAKMDINTERGTENSNASESGRTLDTFIEEGKLLGGFRADYRIG